MYRLPLRRPRLGVPQLNRALSRSFIECTRHGLAVLRDRRAINEYVSDSAGRIGRQAIRTGWKILDATNIPRSNLIGIEYADIRVRPRAKDPAILEFKDSSRFARQLVNGRLERDYAALPNPIPEQIRWQRCIT